MTYFEESKEWQWLFHHGLKWPETLELHYPSYPTPDGLNNPAEVLTCMHQILTAVDQWSAEKISARARYLDENGPGEIVDGWTETGPSLQALYKEAGELQFFGLSAGREYGGADLPVAVNLISFVSVSRACLASSSQMAFFGSIADMLERYCSKEDCARLVPQIIAGTLSGSMSLTEPDSGSAVGALRTTATLPEDGTYRIRGNKIFITNAGGGLSFVLARIKGEPDGVKGVSLFLVEQSILDGDKIKQNYRVTGKEKKLGMRGSFTCQVSFEDSVAKLVGTKNQGLQIMFHLMNGSRIGVGGQAIGIMEACLAYVENYAKERTQFGRPLMELPLYKRNFEQLQTECDAFRAFFIDTMNPFSHYHQLGMKLHKTGTLTPKEQKALKKAERKVRFRTPLIKYYGSELAVEISKKSVQALGGHGFMADHPVARWHRDSLGPVLYEGTSQIQALMVFKDLIKRVLRRPSGFLKALLAEHPFGSKLRKDPIESAFLTLDYRFRKELGLLMVRTLGIRDFKNPAKLEKLMIHAETLCEGLSYLETLRVLSEHALQDKSRVPLFWRYQRLVAPRLARILADWKQSPACGNSM